MSGEWWRAARHAAVLSPLLVAGCGSSGGPGPSPEPTELSAKAQAGKAIFFDTSLSASGKQACGTCHVPSRAFTADPATDQGLPVPLGGANMDLPGFRNAPSLVYASLTPRFTNDDGSPTGGFFRDGRASSLAVQAEQPFVTVFEMANANSAEVVTRLQASAATLALFTAAYGASVLGDPDTTLADMGDALAAYETEAPEFHPFTASTTPGWMARRAHSDTEQRGIALFNNPGKGNCTACHPSQVQSYATRALFTDFSYDNIGIPRNWNIPANQAYPVSPVTGAPLAYMPMQTNVPGDAEYAYYDMGLCGPFAPASNDPQPRPVYTQVKASAASSRCRRCATLPSPRRISTTASSDLHQVLEWYVTRDINNNTGNNAFPVPAGPEGNPYQAVGTFYLAADGTPDLYQYNDLPVDYDANVNVVEIPYTPPTFVGGQAPTLTTAEIDDVVAFLCTLTDGFDPANPAAYNVPAQCQAGAP